MKFLKILTVLALLIGASEAVLAQATNFGMSPVGPTQTMSVTTASSPITLNSSPGNTVLIQNTGSNTAFVKCAATAATTDFPVQAGWGLVLSCPSGHVFSAITASSTTSLYVSQGLGSTALTGGGSGGGGGGGGAVTLAPGSVSAGAYVAGALVDGADITQGATTQSVCGTSTGTCSEIQLLKFANAQLASLVSGLLTPPLQVVGPTADGTAASTNPVLMAGTVDGTGTGAVAIPKLSSAGIGSNFLIDAAGTNAATIKAASTAPASTDTSLVVGINPNSTVTPAATESHLGEVGGNIIPISIGITTSNNTVTTGKSIGGTLTFANAVRVSGTLGNSGTSGILQNLSLFFKDAVAGTSADLYLFNASPSSTCTDNTAFALSNSDLAKVVGIVHITDFTASNTGIIAQANNLAIAYGLSSATSLFGCLVARGSFAITTTSGAEIVANVLRQ